MFWFVDYKGCSSSRETTFPLTDITVVCKVGPKVGGEFVCDAPTTIDDTLTPFYSYYNIPVNY